MKKYRNLIILSLLGLAMIGVICGPILTGLYSRLTTNKQLNQELKAMEKKLADLEGIDKNLVNERVVKMETVFPSDKPVVQLLSTLTQLSGKYSLNFGGVSLSPGSLTDNQTTKDQAEDSLNDMKFGFEVGGTFDNILNFMKELERAAPLMKIDKVGLMIKTSPLVSEQPTEVAAKIDVSAFFKGPPKTIGAITEPVALLTRDDEAILSTMFTFTQFPVILPVAQTGKVDLFAAGLGD
ncbi:MAG: hypothetical protein NTZ93_01325 [Candidatus Beckwithbacteria bacterium]|nr:hypothetical protein [Candidatus Beckwithbacteria bacterium]